jgi:cell division protein FtsL
MKVDNSQIVREVDPHAFRDLLSLLVLVAALVVGLVLYAWPHLQIRQTGMATERLNREKERLIEQGRKLRLEKAALENLRRVESIATKELGMATPAPERVIVVERSESPPEAARVASGETSAATPEPKATGPGARREKQD